MVDQAKAGAAIQQALSSTKPAPLGRGLSALFGDSDTSYQAPAQPVAPASGPGPRQMSVTWLQPGKFQPRRTFGEEALEDLANSIRNHGVLQPLLVRHLKDDQYEIIAGERRWRAAQKANVHTVPVVVRALSDAEALEIALIENVQRQDLSPLEEAEGYQRLIAEFDYTQETMAKAVGKSRSHIANTLRLLQLPETVKTMLRDGAMTAGHARALLSAKDPEQLARAIVAEKLSVRDVEERIRLESALNNPSLGRVGKGAKLKDKARDADLLALEKELTSHLGLKVRLQSNPNGSGTLSIAYQDLDQLDDLLKLLRGA